MELVEKKLSELEAKKLEANDASKRVAELGAKIKSVINQGIDTVNATNSVDEKISTLAGTLQLVSNTINDFSTRHYALLHDLDNKIAVLEEVLEEYIESPQDDLSQE